LLGHFAPKMNAFILAMVQFSFCAFFSSVMVLFNESPNITSVVSSSYSLLYSGILSVGVAFTFQAMAQRKTLPSHAAIIMSLEAVFAVLGGWLMLSETVTARMLIGCAFMLSGMFLSQVRD
jgi:drug/metabolite transporter (DMT)-like permease